MKPIPYTLIYKIKFPDISEEEPRASHTISSFPALETLSISASKFNNNHQMNGIGAPSNLIIPWSLWLPWLRNRSIWPLSLRRGYSSRMIPIYEAGLLKFNLPHPLSTKLTSYSNVVLLRDTWIQDTASNWPGHRDLLSDPLRLGHLSHLSISILQLSWLKSKWSHQLGRKLRDNIMHNYTTNLRKECL